MPAGKNPEQPANGQAAGKEERDEMELNNSAEPDAAIVVLDARVQAQLGRQLSAYYGELVNQPIPDTFIDLLKKLEKSEKGE